MSATDIELLASSAVRPLVIGTTPFPGESLTSVIVRACEENRFRRPSYLLDLIGLKTRAPEFVPFSHIDSADRLAKLLGMTSGEVRRRMHPAAGDDFGRTCVDWFGTSLERRHIEASVRRFSPQWLRAHRTYPAVWMVRPLDFCPMTMELLVSNCPHCSRELGWRACRAVWQCDKCQGSLLDAPTKPVPADLLDAARFGSALVDPSEQVRKAALSSLPAPFSDWSAGDVLSATKAFGGAYLTVLGATAPTGQGLAVAQFAAGLDFINRWPGSLTEYVGESTKRANSTGVRDGLGPLGAMFSSTATRSPLGDLVRSSIPAAFRDAGVPARIWSTARVAKLDRTGTLRAVDAVERLHVDLSSLRRLEGHSPTFIARGVGRGGVALYDEAGIDRLAYTLAQGVRPGLFAVQVGIPSYCVDAFIDAGLVNAVDNPDAAIVTGLRLVDRTSVQRLTHAIGKAAARAPVRSPLSEVMRWRAHPDEWVAIFKCLLSGTLRATLTQGNSPLTERLLVEPAQVALHLPQRSTHGDVSSIVLSIEIASRLLGAGTQLVNAAVKAGELVSAQDCESGGISLESALSFRDRFIGLAEVAHASGIPVQSLRFRLREAGYQPAMEAKRRTVWWRAEVDEFLSQAAPSAVQSRSRGSASEVPTPKLQEELAVAAEPAQAGRPLPRERVSIRKLRRRRDHSWLGGEMSSGRGTRARPR